MGDGLGLYLSDLYPNMTADTSERSTPDVDDQDAMHEETQVAEKASATESSSRNIFLAIGIIALMVVFLGMGGK